jgi:hypothetical protein
MANLTNRQIISDIISDLRAVNLDDKVSKRHILNKLRGFAALFIKRDTDTRRLLNISDIWVDVPCVELCEAPLIDCCNIDIPNCKFVMKSKKKLPEVYETFYKELLEVHNPVYAKEFRQITPKEYKNILAREFQDKRIKYFWISNGHLIIPDSMVEVVTLRGAFINPAEAKKLSGCLEGDDKCISLLDQPFNCPDYLIPVIKQEALKDLYNFYKRTVTDESPNQNNNTKVNDQQ